MEHSAAARFHNTLTQFNVYEDYLDSKITPKDLLYLKSRGLARQLVEQGLNGPVLSREEFEGKKAASEAARSSAGRRSRPTTLASAGKELKDNFLRALAEREEANRSGRMTLLQLEDAGVHVQLQPQLRGALRRPQRPPLQEQEGPEDPECGPAVGRRRGLQSDLPPVGPLHPRRHLRPQRQDRLSFSGRHVRAHGACRRAPGACNLPRVIHSLLPSYHASHLGGGAAVRKKPKKCGFKRRVPRGGGGSLPLVPPERIGELLGDGAGGGGGGSSRPLRPRRVSSCLSKQMRGAGALRDGGGCVYVLPQAAVAPSGGMGKWA
ncbi:cilia- and flagella-associated protein 299 isoform X1 [Gasterosteus aculeatus]